LSLGLLTIIIYLTMKNLLTHNANLDKFVRFLKAHKAFSKFEINRAKSNKRSNYIETLREHIEVCDRQLAVYIGSAFAWGLTSEGREYWNEINIIWVKENKYDFYRIQ
jgi:hypothetical protein